MKKDCRQADARQSLRDFLGDNAGFADAHQDDFTPAIDKNFDGTLRVALAHAPRRALNRARFQIHQLGYLLVIVLRHVGSSEAYIAALLFVTRVAKDNMECAQNASFVVSLLGLSSLASKFYNSILYLDCSTF